MSGPSLTTRPAETFTAAAGIALIVSYLLGVIEVDGNVLVIAGTAVLGALPGAVTALVELRRR